MRICINHRGEHISEIRWRELLPYTAVIDDGKRLGVECPARTVLSLDMYLTVGGSDTPFFRAGELLVEMVDYIDKIINESLNRALTFNQSILEKIDIFLRI